MEYNFGNLWNCPDIVLLKSPGASFREQDAEFPEFQQGSLHRNGNGHHVLHLFRHRWLHLFWRGDRGQHHSQPTQLLVRITNTHHVSCIDNCEKTCYPSLFLMRLYVLFWWSRRMYQIVKLLYCFGIFITFALQFYVPAEILIPLAVARFTERWNLSVDLFIRTALVIFTCKLYFCTSCIQCVLGLDTSRTQKKNRVWVIFPKWRCT